MIKDRNFNWVDQEPTVDTLGVSALIRNEFGEILIFWHKKLQGWTIPVGKVDAAEITPQGIDYVGVLMRELREELGIRVSEEAYTLKGGVNFYWSMGEDSMKEKGMYGYNQIYELRIPKGSEQHREPEKHENPIWVSEDHLLNLDLSKVTNATAAIINSIRMQNSKCVPPNTNI